MAISFAGEDRELARFIADGLRSRWLVFFDEYERAALWGADLSEELPERYWSARYCVMVISDQYLEKMWTVLERQALIEEFLRRKGKDYVLPLRVRGCGKRVPGLSGLVGYIDIGNKNEWPEIVKLVDEKLKAATCH